ncbi:MAG: hypothetical protein QOJ99_1054 [Bryobacterales bacterium]|nr:hypothetical protein [Bryobacterales bacterium]
MAAENERPPIALSLAAVPRRLRELPELLIADRPRVHLERLQAYPDNRTFSITREAASVVRAHVESPAIQFDHPIRRTAVNNGSQGFHSGRFRTAALRRTIRARHIAILDPGSPSGQSYGVLNEKTRFAWRIVCDGVRGAGAISNLSVRKPNIVFIISDQFRADALACMGMNPMNLTPNLDAMARRGVLFTQAITNQPVCAPARGCMLTGQYPAQHGVWKNAMGLKRDAVTLPGLLRDQGYTANFIGKWLLSAQTPTDRMSGPVPVANRGGFLDFWEAANALELTSHPFEGDVYDGDGKPLHFEGEYRADFLTSRAVRFLKEKRQKDRPFLLMVSYLEVHHQNDTDLFVPPKKYANKYRNPWVPQDLRPLPGTWPSHLPGYYGSVAGIDDASGHASCVHQRRRLENDTVVVFTSDHGCHFRSRNSEYKRSPHESSIHIPLIMQGPGFNRAMEVPELVSQVDLAPTLLDAVRRNGAPQHAGP